MGARTSALLAVGMALASVLAGAFAGTLATGPTPILALTIPAILVPVLFWKSPRVGLFVLLFFAVTVEQFGYLVAEGRPGAVTAKVPFFTSFLPAGLTLAEVVLGLTLLIVVMRAVGDRVPWIHPSPVLSALLAVWAFVAFYFMIGVFRGGDFKMALWEIRPFIYLLGAFLLASHLFRRSADISVLLWIIVLGSGAKAAYGLTIFASVRGLDQRPEAILAHEESYFFGLFIVLTVGMWLFRYQRSVRTVATLLLPIVMVANMVNSRRTAWLILISGLAVLFLVALVRVKEYRKVTALVVAVAALGASVYLPIFWNKEGTMAQPARAFRSVVAPDIRDESSNEYRDIEDYNIETMISASHSTGLGFGQPITYFGLVDLTETATMLEYVPHNGVLYLWLRMGILGVVTFAVFVAQAAISAVRLAASRRREAAMIGAVTASILFGYVAMGGTDMGFFWFRNALAMGLLVGAVDGLARSDRDESAHLQLIAASPSEAPVGGRPDGSVAQGSSQ